MHDLSEPENLNSENPIKRARIVKTETKEQDRMVPFANRIASPIWIGAHVSAAKGVENSILNSIQIGGNAFSLFLKSQRKWESPPLSHASIYGFRDACKEYLYNPKLQILPHGSYLVNLANPDTEKREKVRERER